VNVFEELARVNAQLDGLYASLEALENAIADLQERRDTLERDVERAGMECAA